MEQAEHHMEKIRLFNDKVIAAFSEIDQNTGKRMIRMNERGFEIMIQKEKDKFYLETGLTPEQVQKFIRQEKLKSLDTETLQKAREAHLESLRKSINIPKNEKEGGNKNAASGVKAKTVTLD